MSANPFKQAIEQGKTADVRKLLDAGANVNQRLGIVGTPLHLAAEKGHVDIVRLLLDRGADVDAQNMEQNTPLHLVAAALTLRTRTPIGRLLLDHGADPTLRGAGQTTPIQKAATRLDHLAYERGDGKLGDMKSFMRLLVRNGATLDAPPGYRDIGESGGPNSRVRAAFIRDLREEAQKVPVAARGLAEVASKTGFTPDINANIMQFFKTPSEGKTTAEVERKREAHRRMTRSQYVASRQNQEQLEKEREEYLASLGPEERAAAAEMRGGRRKTRRRKSTRRRK